MNTKKTSFVMLGIGLAVGMVIGFSVNSPSITAKERAYLKDREALETALSQFKSTYMARLESQQETSPIADLKVAPQQRQIELPHFKIQSNPHEYFLPDAETRKPKDLIDQRYTPPHIEPQ